MPHPQTIQKAKEIAKMATNTYEQALRGGKYSIVAVEKILEETIIKFAEQYALENCTCKEDETTGAMEEWVCNNCGRTQK